MWSSVVTRATRAASSPRAAAVARASCAMGCGNLGALPRPPWERSDAATRAAMASSTSAGVGRSVPPSEQRRATERAGELVGLLEELVAPRAPQLLDPLAQLDEPDHPAPPLLREVGPGEEGPAVGRADDRHGPAALACHGLGRLHVDVVDVGPLLAVDLHVHEHPVHHGRHVGVLEGLVGHHVAPVAGRVADRQQDRYVSLPGRGEGIVAPRVPVDRVVGVLAQVGARLPSEAVHTDSLAASEPGSALPCGGDLGTFGPVRPPHPRPTLTA